MERESELIPFCVVPARQIYQQPTDRMWTEAVHVIASGGSIKIMLKSLLMQLRYRKPRIREPEFLECNCS